MWCKRHQVRSQFGDRIIMHVFPTCPKRVDATLFLSPMQWALPALPIIRNTETREVWRLQHQHISVYCSSWYFIQIRTNHLISHQPISNWQLSASYSQRSLRQIGRDVFGAESNFMYQNLYEFQPSKNVPWLRRLVAGLSTLRPEFDSGPVQEVFVNNVAMGQIFLRLLWFSPALSLRPPMLHTHIFTLLLSEGQTGEAWKPDKAILIRGKKVLQSSDC